MNFVDAWTRVAMAGRELGGGPSRSVKRMVPDYDGTLGWLIARNVPSANAGGILIGIAVGMVMAEDKHALNTLESIEANWLAGGHEPKDDD